MRKLVAVLLTAILTFGLLVAFPSQARADLKPLYNCGGWSAWDPSAGWFTPVCNSMFGYPWPCGGYFEFYDDYTVFVPYTCSAPYDPDQVPYFPYE